MTEPESGARTPTILVVEDDRTLAAALERHFARDGHRIVTAHPGAAGLAALREAPCALLIVDAADANLELFAALGDGDVEPPARIPLSPAAGPCHRAFQTRRPVIVLTDADLAAAPAMDPALLGHPFFRPRRSVVARRRRRGDRRRQRGQQDDAAGHRPANDRAVHAPLPAARDGAGGEPAGRRGAAAGRRGHPALPGHRTARRQPGPRPRGRRDHGRGGVSGYLVEANLSLQALGERVAALLAGAGGPPA